MSRPRWAQWIGDPITRSPWLYVILLVVFICVSPFLAALTTTKVDYDAYEAYSSRKVPEFNAHDVYSSSFDLSRTNPSLLLLEATTISSLVGTGGRRQLSTNKSLSLTKEFGAMACKLAEVVLDKSRGTSFEIASPNIDNAWWDGDMRQCRNKDRIDALLRSAPGQDEVLTSKQGNEMIMSIYLNNSISDTGSEAQAMLEEFWGSIEPEAASWTFYVDGVAHQFRATLYSPLAEEILLERQHRKILPWELLGTVLIACCIVGYAFSSAFVAVKLIFTVVVPILVEYGMLVGIYQAGWLRDLGIEETHGLFRSMIYYTVGFLFALAIDYDLFLFARVYERRLEGYDNRSAVRIALEETSPTITLAGSLMVLSFFFIFLSSLPIVSQLGCLYCLGVAFDTYVVRIWIAPAALCIYGPMNYWPNKMPPPAKEYCHYMESTAPNETLRSTEDTNRSTWRSRRQL